MSEGEGYVFSSTEVCEPVPAERAFTADDDVLAVRFDRFEEAFWLCWRVTVKDDLAMLVG